MEANCTSTHFALTWAAPRMRKLLTPLFVRTESLWSLLAPFGLSLHLRRTTTLYTLLAIEKSNRDTNTFAYTHEKHSLETAAALSLPEVDVYLVDQDACVRQLYRGIYSRLDRVF